MMKLIKSKVSLRMERDSTGHHSALSWVPTSPRRCWGFSACCLCLGTRVLICDVVVAMAAPLRLRLRLLLLRPSSAPHRSRKHAPSRVAVKTSRRHSKHNAIS